MSYQVTAQRRCDCGNDPAVFSDGPLTRARRVAEVIRAAASMPQRHSLATDLLWTRLRDGLGGFSFRCCRSVCGYRVDFVCVETALLIQVDGAANTAYDARGTVILAECGFRVLRFWGDEIVQRIDAVLEEILRQLRCGDAATEAPPTGEPG